MSVFFEDTAFHRNFRRRFDLALHQLEQAGCTLKKLAGGGGGDRWGRSLRGATAEQGHEKNAIGNRRLVMLRIFSGRRGPA